MRAEGIGNRGERLAKIFAQHLLIGHIVGNLAQAVHVVGKRDQPRGHIAHLLEGVAHPARARDFAEGADMGQAGRAIARLEQDILERLARLGAALDAGEQFARLLERPGVGGKSSGRRKYWKPLEILNLKRFERGES